MRALTLLFAAVLMNLAGTKVSAATLRAPTAEGKTYSCRVMTGHVVGFGQGKSKSAARENARLDCGEKMVDQYFALRGDIPEDAIGDMTTACVNLECQ